MRQRADALTQLRSVQCGHLMGQRDARRAKPAGPLASGTAVGPRPACPCDVRGDGFANARAFPFTEPCLNRVARHDRGRPTKQRRLLTEGVVHLLGEAVPTGASACSRRPSWYAFRAVADRIIHWLIEDLTWRGVVLGASLSLGTMIGSLLLVGFLLVKLPTTYFQEFHSRDV